MKMNNEIRLCKEFEEYLKEMVGDVFNDEFEERRHLYPYIDVCNLMINTLDFKYNIPFNNELISDKMNDLIYYELKSFFKEGE